MTKKCSECGWETDDTETLPEDLHEDWCPQLTGKSRQWTENSIHASRDPAWAADEIERLTKVLHTIGEQPDESNEWDAVARYFSVRVWAGDAIGLYPDGAPETRYALEPAAPETL